MKIAKKWFSWHNWQNLCLKATILSACLIGHSLAISFIKVLAKFCGSFMFFSVLCFAMSLCASVDMCLVVTCWERADLLAIVYDV